MTVHARLSASGSHRWLYCPGSVKAEESLPNTTSYHAEEGTAAHELAELALMGSGNARDWLGKQLPESNAFTVTDEMANAVQVYVDYVRGFSGEHAYEQRIDFGDWVPEGFGTADAVIVQDDKIRVIDLKYGRGLRVDAEENTQAILYALGVYAEHELFIDIKNVVITIVQPRLDHIDEWEISISELLKRGEWIRQRAEEANSPDAERVPGEAQCLWCKAKATCPALMKFTNAAIMSDFETLDLVNVDRLTDSQLRQALDSKKLIIGWLDAVEMYIKERVENGGAFEGYKMVEGRSSRSWSDEKLAIGVLESELGEQAWEKKLLSVAKAERSLGKAKLGVISDLVLRSSGKPTLVPESDKRPALGATADDFDCLK